MSRKKEIKIGVIGLGNIGSKLVPELQKQSIDFEKETGLVLKITKTSDAKEEKRIPAFEFVKNAYDLINDKRIDMIVELIGGEHPAYEIINYSLKAGKNVVTANKLLISKYGKELEETALKNKKYLRFNAAVGGGIGLIEKIVNHEGNDTKILMGILNGTTNYILTRMHEGLDYETALKEAQEKGFAEANPEFDISGKDAAQKLAILSSINFKTFISGDKLYCEGIQKIKKEDIDFAKNSGYVIKLLATSKLTGEELEAKVMPIMINKNHPLASVNYETNALYMLGNANIKVEGEGAGRATIASLISDIKNIAREMCYSYKERRFFGSNNFNIKPIEETESKFYLKFYGLNKPGTLYSLTGTLLKEKINIESALQLETEGEFIPMFFTTSQTKYGKIKNAIKNIDKKKLKEGNVIMIANDF